jgi:FkbM family methyltransferase
MREMMLQLARYLKASPIRNFTPRFIKKIYWRLATSSSIYPIMDLRMYLPPDDRVGERGLQFLLEQYEPAVMELLSRQLREGMTFCDVGANIGIFSLVAARRVGPKGHVVAIEPVPGNGAILRKNIALNHFSNIDVIEKAVHDQLAEVKMFLSNARGCESIFPAPLMATGRVVTVDAVRLDSIPQLCNVDVLKVDAEGAEIAVLQSLGKIRPTDVIVEYNQERQAAAGLSGSQFLRRLRDLGYTDIRNLDDPLAGVEAIENGTVSSINLHLRPR